MNTLTLTQSGIPELRAKLTAIAGKIEGAMVAATVESLMFCEASAQSILTEGIYAKPRGAFESPLTGQLLENFTQSVVMIGAGVISGTLANITPYAHFFEFGTDMNTPDHKHWIPVVSGKALHWMDGETGEDRFSKGHWVTGIDPLYFMERSLRDNHGPIIEIYRKHLIEAFHG